MKETYEEIKAELRKEKIKIGMYRMEKRCMRKKIKAANH